MEPGLDSAFLRYIGVTTESQVAIRGFYLPLFEGCRRVVDLGCGTGEFVQLLIQSGIDALGVDSDPTQCESLRARGVPVVERDVIRYLESVEEESLEGLYSAHLVEHLPYENVLKMIRLCYRALKPGGRLVVATPNPRSPMSHLELFHMHFGHEALYHPRLLMFFLNHCGFHEIEEGENPHTPTLLGAASLTVPDFEGLFPLENLENFAKVSIDHLWESPLKSDRAHRRWIRRIKRLVQKVCVWPLVGDVIIQANEILRARYVALLRLQQALQSVHGTLAGMMAFDRPFECYVIGHKPTSAAPNSRLTRGSQWQFEGPYDLEGNPPAESVIRNTAMKRIYTDIMKDKETSAVTMLHREDLYASGPPTTVASKEMLELTSEHAGHRILDVGCGIGVFGKELNKRGFECVGIEWDDAIAKEAGRSIEAYFMSAEELEFEDDSFDTVIMFEVLEHLRSPEKALQEIKRVTRKNLILSVPNLGPLVECVEHNVIMHHFFETTHFNFFTKSMLERFLKEFFEHVHVGEFGRFFNASGQRLFYHLYAIASFEEINV